MATSSGFRPPQWSRPLLYSMTVSAPVQDDESGSDSGQSSDSGLGGASRQKFQDVSYYFDAVLKVDHYQNLRHTEHPIQSGSSIVDHAYLTPARIALEIAMSDAMARYSTGLYTSDRSKSVAFYNKLLDIQSARAPVTLRTRLKTYANMLIEDIRAQEDSSTIAGFKGTVYFYELIVGTVTSAANGNSSSSARPDQTNSTNAGAKQPRPVPPDVQKYVDILNGKAN